MSGFTHEFSFALSAEPARVFRALTEPGELRRWFCEHADIEPRVGGAFRFWGKHTYGTPTRAEATQKILKLEPGTAISFSWNLAGQPSEVTLTLAALDVGEAPPPWWTAGIVAGTTLQGTHRFADAPAIGRARELVEDLWRLACANLQQHLGGGEGVLLPDFNDAHPEVRASILIDAPRERVFAALLNPEMLNRWIAAAAQVEPRAGGKYTYGWTYQIGGRDVLGGPTRILEMVENEKLVTDWPDWRGDPAVPTQKVTWLLESVGKKTRVTVVHTGFVRTADVGDYPFGWLGFLRQLQQTLESAATFSSQGQP